MICLGCGKPVKQELLINGFCGESCRSQYEALMKEMADVCVDKGHLEAGRDFIALAQMAEKAKPQLTKKENNK